MICKICKHAEAGPNKTICPECEKLVEAAGKKKAELAKKRG